MPKSTPEVGKSGPVRDRSRKRLDGGPALSQIWTSGNDPADGGWADSRRALARGLLGRPAEPQLVFESLQFVRTRPGRPAATAACGRQRPGQGRPDPAAVGGR